MVYTFTPKRYPNPVDKPMAMLPQTAILSMDFQTFDPPVLAATIPKTIRKKVVNS